MLSLIIIGVTLLYTIPIIVPIAVTEHELHKLEKRIRDLEEEDK